MSDHLSRARTLLAAQPECWRKCAVLWRKVLEKYVAGVRQGLPHETEVG